MATPSGRLQCQPRNANSVDSVFCAMKISRTSRITKPGTSADQTAEVLVNLTALPCGCSGEVSGRSMNGGGTGSPGSGACKPSGRFGDAEGSLVMTPCLPFGAAIE